MFLLLFMPPRQVPAHLQQDTYSIFNVHPIEGPFFLVVSLKLNGCNYLVWIYYMQRALGTKKKLAFMRMLLMFGRISRNLFQKLIIFVLLYLCSFINKLKQGSRSLLDYFIKIRSVEVIEFT